LRAAGRLENDEVGNMLPINVDSDEGLGGTSDERFGPDVSCAAATHECGVRSSCGRADRAPPSAHFFQAVLLVGFLRDEVARVRGMLDEMGADFVRVVLLDQQMLEGTLGAALAAPPAMPQLQPTATGVPRVLFISGMSGAEAVSIIDAFQLLGAPPTQQLLPRATPAAAHARCRAARFAAQSCRRPSSPQLCRAASASPCVRCVLPVRARALAFAPHTLVTRTCATLTPARAAAGGDSGRQRPARRGAVACVGARAVLCCNVTLNITI
jgi:hypothetical protein